MCAGYFRLFTLFLLNVYNLPNLLELNLYVVIFVDWLWLFLLCFIAYKFCTTIDVQKKTTTYHIGLVCS